MKPIEQLPLDQLKAALDQESVAVERGAHAKIKSGRLLSQIKQRVGRDFDAWLERNYRFSRRTACRRIAEYEAWTRLSKGRSVEAAPLEELEEAELCQSAQTDGSDRPAKNSQKGYDLRDLETHRRALLRVVDAICRHHGRMNCEKAAELRSRIEQIISDIRAYERMVSSRAGRGVIEQPGRVAVPT